MTTLVPDSETRIAELEATLEQRDHDIVVLASVLRSRSIIMGDPLQEFFDHPDWEFYPVNPSAECHKECGDDLDYARKQCQPIADEDDRRTCMERAWDQLRLCAKGCDGF